MRCTAPIASSRNGAVELKLSYSLAVPRSTTTVWAQERQPLPPKPRSGKRGDSPPGCGGTQTHQPVTVKQLAKELAQKTWREITWREGSKEPLHSRFAALRVRPAYGDDRKTAGLQPEQWLLKQSGPPEPRSPAAIGWRDYR